MALEFSAAQERLAHIVMEQVRERDKSRVILACGLTGVGKKTVLTELEGEMGTEGMHTSWRFLLDPNNRQLVKDSQTHFVTSCTPRELASAKELLVKDIGLTVVGVNVKPLTLDEAVAYIERLRHTYGLIKTAEDLSNDNLAALTMGIYGHINRFFELKAAGEFYHPRNIRDALKNDLPENSASGPQPYSYLDLYSNIPQFWSRTGL